MASKFRIYSSEITATLDPDNAVPAPITNIVFDDDPILGKYEQANAGDDRGSIVPTFGGAVIQDFGIKEADETISFEANDALVQTTVDSLQTAYETIDEQWYFTDGYNCWLVQFSRNPRGFRSWRNLISSFHGYHVFSYTINLLVISKEI